MRKFLTLLSVLMLTTVMGWAQGLVSGVIKDATGEAISFATVKVEGTNVSSQTDANGFFSIKAAAGASFVISAKGYETKTAPSIAGFNSFTLAKASAGDGKTEDVVVTALGIKKKPRDMGTAISRVSPAELTNGKAPGLAQSLSGKASGLLIQQTSGGVNNSTKVNLRGFRSITGNNDALIVLDGAPVPSNIFNYLNPNDVADITILKGGQAATLYGSDGVNGAILITTKKGTKGTPDLRFNSSISFDDVSYMPKTQDTYGNGSNYGGINSAENYRPFENQSYGDRYDGSLRAVGRTINAAGDYLSLPYAAIKNVRKKYFDRGTTLTNDVSLSGGSADSKFSLSAQAVNTKGVVPGDKSDRYSFRATSSKDFGKLGIVFIANVVNEKVDYTNSTYLNNVLNTAAHFDPAFYKNWRTNPYANPNGYYNAYTDQPFWDKDNRRQVDDKTYVNANIEATYRIRPWLTLGNRLAFAYTNTFSKAQVGQFKFSAFAKLPGIVPAGGPYAGNTNEDYSGNNQDEFGNVSDGASFGQRLNNDITLTAKRKFGSIDFSGLVGANLQVRKGRSLSVGSSALLVEGIYNVGLRTGELTGGESKSEVRKYGYYADANFGYNNYLNLHLTGRIDGSSVFYADNRKRSQYQYPYFGADISAVLSDIIPSLKDNKTINYLKVRAAANKNGNDNLGAYGLTPIFGVGGGFPYGSLAGTTVGNNLPSPDLKPEFITTYEAGVEAAFLNNKLNVEFTVYNSKSVDQVVNITTSPSTGYTANTLNIGESKNWGYEVDVKAKVISKRKWSVDLSARYSRNNNEAITLAQGLDDLNLLSNAQAAVYVKKGAAFPALRAVAFLRDPASNKIVVSRLNGYPQVAPGLKDFGRTTPRDIVGLTANVKYGQFSLSTTAEYRGGHVIYNGVGRTLSNSGTGAFTTAYDRRAFIFPNSVYADNSGKYVDNNDVATQNGHYVIWVDVMSTIAENYVTSAAFWKLRDLSLSYNVPSNWIKKTKIFKSATVGAFGRNLLMLVPKENIFGDPEQLTSAASSGGTVGNGIGFNDTEGALPATRSYGLTLNFGF
jgi:TonB-linked SusC/RagA family outer membrane protein